MAEDKSNVEKLEVISPGPIFRATLNNLGKLDPDGETVKLSDEEILTWHDVFLDYLGRCEVDLIVFGDMSQISQLEADLKKILWSFTAFRAENGVYYLAAPPLELPRWQLETVFKKYPQFTFLLHWWFTYGGEYEVAVWESGVETPRQKGKC